MGMKKRIPQHHQELAVEPRAAVPMLLVPKHYKVYLINDDYTPMDFVVEVLKRYFFMDHNHAIEVMLQVHNLGKGICGLYTREVAETKVVQVNEYARRNQHPLLCKMEETSV